MSTSRNLKPILGLVLAMALSQGCIKIQDPLGTDEGGATDVTGKITNPDTLAQLTTGARQKGNATGDDFSGTYAIKAGIGKFVGKGCTADFLETYDLAINLSLSHGEMEEIIQEGHPPATGELELVQEDGGLKILGVGNNDHDLSGWINQDGTFLLAEGNLHQDPKIRGAGFVIRGKVGNDQIEGEMIEFVYRFDQEPDAPQGLCANQTPFSGER